MLKAIGLGAIVVGAILLFYGLKEREAVTSQVVEAITGSPTDNSMMLMVSGGGLVAVGIGLTIFGKRS